MKCINHPEVDAAGPCVKCGTGLCDDCRRELGMRFYCQSCAHEILTQKTAPAATVTSGRNRKRNGIRLLVLGIIGFVLAFLFSLLALGMGGNDNPQPGTGMVIYILIALSVISPILFIIGLTRVVIDTTWISTAALVFGILSLLCGPAFMLGASVPLGLLATVFGAIALARLKKNPLRGGRKTAIAGIVLGIIGIVAYGIFYLVWEIH